MTNPARLALAALLALSAANAAARDDQLVADMATLDRAYVNPLFFTSAQNLAKTTETLAAFEARWSGFAAAYRSYRPAAASWGSHFDAVDQAVAEAAAIVAATNATCAPAAPCPALVAAHDALEAVRFELRDLRTHNGFPKFVTDRLTAFHDPMEAIALSVKDLAPAQITDALLAVLSEQAAEADLLWQFVERTPIDDAWGFTDAQRAAIGARIAAEREAIELFAAAVAAADRAAIPALGAALKTRFVPVYTAFASDPALNRLP